MSVCVRACVRVCRNKKRSNDCWNIILWVRKTLEESKDSPHPTPTPYILLGASRYISPETNLIFGLPKQKLGTREVFKNLIMKRIRIRVYPVCTAFILDNLECIIAIVRVMDSEEKWSSAQAMIIIVLCDFFSFYHNDCSFDGYFLFIILPGLWGYVLNNPFTDRLNTAFVGSCVCFSCIYSSVFWISYFRHLLK